MCSVYIAGSQSSTVEDLIQLINQLPSPIMLLGDFNAQNELWGSNRTEPRGRKLQKVLFDAELNTLNDGTSTRIEYNGKTAIDLSIVSPELSDVLQWYCLSRETVTTVQSLSLWLTEKGRMLLVCS